MPLEKRLGQEAGQEATVRTGHGTTDWFQIGKGVMSRLYIVTPLFNLYAEYIMQNARLDEAEAGFKISRKNINNFRYVDDTTLMAECEEKLKSLLKVYEESEKVGLKLNIQKTKIIASGPIISWKVDGEKNGNSDRLYLLGLKITVCDDSSHEIKTHFLLKRKAMTNLDSILKSRDITFADKRLYS